MEWDGLRYQLEDGLVQADTTSLIPVLYDWTKLERRVMQLSSRVEIVPQGEKGGG